MLHKAIHYSCRMQSRTWLRMHRTISSSTEVNQSSDANSWKDEPCPGKQLSCSSFVELLQRCWCYVFFSLLLVSFEDITRAHYRIQSGIIKTVFLFPWLKQFSHFLKWILCSFPQNFILSTVITLNICRRLRIAKYIWRKISISLRDLLRRGAVQALFFSTFFILLTVAYFILQFV
jgi:hypothetical protein